MSVYRSAMGKSVDMSAIVAKNEKVRAVGNMRVNARGDTIDAEGRVIQSVNEKVNNAYSKTVGNRGSQVIKKPHEPIKPDTTGHTLELTAEELELEESFNDDLEVEQIKAEELKKAAKKK